MTAPACLPKGRADPVAFGMPAAKRSFTQFSSAELGRLRALQEQGKPASEVATLLGRDISSVCRHFKRNRQKTGKAVRPVGRPSALTDAQVDRVVSATEKMVKAADGTYQVTAKMVKTSLKLKCCLRTLRQALHARGVRFHPMREKPVRTDSDDKERLQFAMEHHKKPASYWANSVHAYIDNKSFPVHLTGPGRTYAAKRAAHGTYRARGQGLADGHVKPRKSLKVTFGKGVMVAVALSSERVLMCHVITGKWNAGEAADMYRNALGPAGRKKFLIVEDNDPSGYKSKAAVEAKSEVGISPMPFPKRSPDLNPLDYGFWDCVNRRLRKQEAAFPYAKRESRAAFVQRLRRTILRVPASVLSPMVKSMKRRCEALKDARGKHFEE